MRANHNKHLLSANFAIVVSNVPKILKWEQITTITFNNLLSFGCFQCSKDTKMRANHNYSLRVERAKHVVSNVPKILKWEQITTKSLRCNLYRCCFQCSKDTKMRANHNKNNCKSNFLKVVSNVPKILKWEQITTTTGTKNGENMLFPMFQRY